MKTKHDVRVGDARNLTAIEDNSVDLVVTSPPYPMIEMWDDAFAGLDSDIGVALDNADGDKAFELMHDVLDGVWSEIKRVLSSGGIACINIGDATRTLGGEFELYPNHAEIISRFHNLGFQSLPTIHWRKPTTKKTKFMGSGMIPSNAYVTLEHENILIFRNGGKRVFKSKSDKRYEAAYFWEERNQWFTDTWMDVGAVNQSLDIDTRERSAAYPFELPYRLINMYSVYDDTVLDPFLGTGTTSIAAAVAGRNSIGYDIDGGLVESSLNRFNSVSDIARQKIRDRLSKHNQFVAQNICKYEALHYATRVKTKQERNIQFYVPVEMSETSTGYRIKYGKYEV